MTQELTMNAARDGKFITQEMAVNDARDDNEWWKTTDHDWGGRENKETYKSDLEVIPNLHGCNY